MGYTHYYYLPEVIEQDTFDAIVADIQKVTKASGVTLSGDWERLIPPVLDDDMVLFNGVGEGAHETFYFSQTWTPAYPGREPHRDDAGRIFHFCKTARKFYDIAVTAALIVVKHHLGELAHVSSDGENADWQPGRDLAQSTLGYGAEYAIQGEGDAYGLYPVEVAA
jgi:hypothetical protein